MPVGFFHCTSRNANTCSSPPGAIGPLLAGCGVILFKNPFDLELDLLRVALVAQEEGLFTIADKNESVMRNAGFGGAGHFFGAPPGQRMGYGAVASECSPAGSSSRGSSSSPLHGAP